MARLAKEKQKINPFSLILGNIAEKPRHLSVYKTKETPDSEGFTFEELTVQTELDDTMAEFKVFAVIPCDNICQKAKIIIKDNKMVVPETDTCIFAINAKDVARALEPHLAPTRRKADASGHLALLAWASVRVCEYICHRFKLQETEIFGDDIYWLSAEYASSVCESLCKGTNNRTEIDENFVNKNQKLFSPRFARNGKIQDICKF